MVNGDFPSVGEFQTVASDIQDFETMRRWAIERDALTRDTLLALERVGGQVSAHQKALWIVLGALGILGVQGVSELIVAMVTGGSAR